MVKQIDVRKNIIGNYYLDFLKDKLINDNVWSYLPSVVNKNLTKDDESFGFTVFLHRYIDPEFSPIEPYHTLLLPLILTLQEKHELKNFFILRVRFGLILNKDRKIINTPHVDFEYDDKLAKNHKNILFYFNTTDAPTYIYNETSEGISDSVQYGTENKQNFTINSEIPCVENTSVLFDGENFHSSTTPLDSQWRLVLNINGVENDS